MAFRVETNAEPIPGYRLIERLGGGGFGEVWKAEAPGGLLKAIKFVYGNIDDCGEDGMRAEQELKSLSRIKTIRHPYILSLERYEIVDGQLCIVMELADRNLWDRFKECRVEGLPGIPRDELLNYSAEVAEALDLMNMEYGLQHLDIKPQNLFLVHNHIKIADFGLVKDLEGMVAKVTGGVTPIYAAPETFDGWVSRFSDQYSLAIVYQELLSGHRPYSGVSVRQLIVQHMSGSPDLSSLPAHDRNTIARALAKKPEDRFPTCHEMVQALRQLRRPAASAGRVPAVSAPEASPSAPVTVSPGMPGEPAAPVNQEADGDAPKLTLADSPEGSPATQLLVVRPGTMTPAPLPAPNTDRPRGIPQAVHGDGILYPALILGLGELGLKIVLAAREKIAARFGSLSALGHLRFLGIDTRPETLREANQSSTGLSLAQQELIATRLNRPSHYLRQRDDREGLEAWLDTRMLYRISRTMETGGIRALGRLAFYDHFGLIARAVRHALEACTEQETLLRASRSTQLGLRSNRPRVYVACSLMGGTGSGMFIDTAYLMRKILRDMGYEGSEVIGLFLVPHVDRGSTRTHELGNTYAAFKELAHFSAPDSQFHARYADKDSTIDEQGAPFVRSFLLEMPDCGTEPAGNRETVELAGEFLSRELLHPMGRTADFSRAVLPPALEAPTAVVCHAFGSERFAFPRRQLVQEAGRSVCRRLIDSWIGKDGGSSQSLVEEKTREHWVANGLETEAMIQHLMSGCERWLQKSPESLLSSATAGALTSLTQFAEWAQKALKQKDALDGPSVPIEPMEEALTQIEGLLGKPGDDKTAADLPPIVAALVRVTEDVVAGTGQKLAEAAVGLIERPGCRLAAAEAAVRLFVGMVAKTLEHHEPLRKELTEKSAEAHRRLPNLFEQLRSCFPLSRRTLPAAAATAQELVELFRNYPKWRFQTLVLQQFTTVYISLRGNLSDLLHEIGNCRVTLSGIRNAMGADRFVVDQDPLRALVQADSAGSRTSDDADKSRNPAAPTHCHALFPHGVRELNHAVRRLLNDLTPPDVQQIDERVQAALARQYGGLVAVCLASASVRNALDGLMQGEAENALSERLASLDVGELFFEQYPDNAAGRQLASSFERAHTTLGVPPKGGHHEIAVLGLPQSRAGDRIRQIAVEQLGKNNFVAVTSDDVAIYRENSFINLADLEQLGPLAQQAYRQMLAAEHFTPHTRLDIESWETPTSTPVALQLAD